jgi:hypothetical protein
MLLFFLVARMTERQSEREERKGRDDGGSTLRRVE